ncbi:hypothetical protein CEXT_230311 [Caerostris extrusa]|uniref:Uncharacterized protein n=1 Tax=Caerostris extrusa TaxID=172846 RepID=A0AAV4Q3V7_CAEEX|nr:hypothetical protein CEXT_230311 [Caerostris extrusa]
MENEQNEIFQYLTGVADAIERIILVRSEELDYICRYVDARTTRDPKYLPVSACEEREPMVIRLLELVRAHQIKIDILQQLFATTVYTARKYNLPGLLDRLEKVIVWKMRRLWGDAQYKEFQVRKYKLKIEYYIRMSKIAKGEQRFGSSHIHLFNG